MIIKKAERQRIDAFELWCWRRLLNCKEIQQSILKEISPEYSLEGLMLKLKLQYFGHLMWRAGSFEKTLMLGKIEGRRRRGRKVSDGWMASLTQWTWVWVNSRSWWWAEKPGVLWSIGSQRVGHNWATELNWTEDDCVLYVWVCSVSQSCPTVCDPMDWSTPRSSVHGIFQARLL